MATDRLVEYGGGVEACQGMVPTHIVCDAGEDEGFDDDVYPEHVILRTGWLYTAVVEACGMCRRFSKLFFLWQNKCISASRS